MDDSDTTPSKKLASEIVRFIATQENISPENIMVALCILITTFGAVHQFEVEHFKEILDTVLKDYENQIIRNQDI